jgi:hypothetical protein
MEHFKISNTKPSNIRILYTEFISNDSGYISSDIILADIVEIEVGVDLIGDLSKITIMVSPNGSVINLKKVWNRNRI